MPLQIKRGTNTQRLAYTPVEGEIVYVTNYVAADVDPAWIGDGSTAGGVTISSSGSGITDIESDTTPTLGGDLDLSGYEINGIGNIDITGSITASGAITSATSIAGTFTGDLQGSVFADDSTTIVDGLNGNISTSRINSLTNVLTINNNGTDADSNEVLLNSLNERSIVNLVRESETDLDGDTASQYGAIFFSRDDVNGQLTTGLIFGRENSIYIGQSSDGDMSTGDKYVVWKDQKLGVGITSPTVELDVSGDAAISGSLTAGAILLSGSNIDTDDSSAITVTPGVTFSSDVVVENDLTVRNTLTVDTLEVTNFQTVGGGTPELESDTDLLLTAGTRVEVTSSPLKMASFTTTERNALTPENGDIIYNTTDNKFQGYENGAWANLI